MSARKNVAKINLLPQIEFNSSFWGRVLLWALSSFRIIVILIEMVVMLAFMSRFWLDAKSNDLNDAIKQKSGVIAVWSDFEKEFKSTQKRLDIFKQLTVNSNLVSSTLNKVTSYLPSDIILNSYSFINSQIEIKGQSATEMAIAQLCANLKNDKQTWGNILVQNISSDSDNPNLLNFDIKFDLNGKATN
jgi:hypothetical protein